MIFLQLILIAMWADFLKDVDNLFTQLWRWTAWLLPRLQLATAMGCAFYALAFLDSYTMAWAMHGAFLFLLLLHASTGEDLSLP